MPDVMTAVTPSSQFNDSVKTLVNFLMQQKMLGAQQEGRMAEIQANNEGEFARQQEVSRSYAATADAKARTDSALEDKKQKYIIDKLKFENVLKLGADPEIQKLRGLHTQAIMDGDQQGAQDIQDQLTIKVTGYMASAAKLWKGGNMTAEDFQYLMDGPKDMTDQLLAAGSANARADTLWNRSGKPTLALRQEAVDIQKSNVGEKETPQHKTDNTYLSNLEKQYNLATKENERKAKALETDITPDGKTALAQLDAEAAALSDGLSQVLSLQGDIGPAGFTPEQKTQARNLANISAIKRSATPAPGPDPWAVTKNAMGLGAASAAPTPIPVTTPNAAVTPPPVQAKPGQAVRDAYYTTLIGRGIKADRALQMTKAKYGF